MSELVPEYALARSTAFLRRHGLHETELPLIEDPKDLSPPDAQSVARRALVLAAMVAVGFDDSIEDWRAWLHDVGLADSLSACERRFFHGNPSDQDKTNATWLAECVQVLLWGLGLAELDHFRSHDGDPSARMPHGGSRQDVTGFLMAAQLRPFADIYLECDLLYRLHWVTRHTSLSEVRSRLDDEIIRERHKAINWLAGVEADWDEVTTDT
jgi:hypothetical protein